MGGNASRGAALSRGFDVAAFRCHALIDAFGKSLAKLSGVTPLGVFLYSLPTTTEEAVTSERHVCRCGIEESRVRGGRRRARRPHASKLLRKSAKAEATKVARTSGGRAISRERRGKSAGGGRPTSAGAVTKGN